MKALVKTIVHKNNLFIKRFKYPAPVLRRWVIFGLSKKASIMKFGVVVFPGSNCDRDLIHVLQDVAHHALLVDHERGALDPHRRRVARGLFDPDAVGLRGRVVGVAEQVEVQVVLRVEPGEGRHLVGADTQHHGVVAAVESVLTA